jgi:peptidyl-prolyl cis-trans isomerase D
MVDAFNDFIFDNPVGRIGLVETEFGYHVVKVEAKRDVYSVATVTLRIEPSETTTNTLFTDATTFEMKVSDAEPNAFSTIANEGGYTVRPISQLKVLDENLPGLGTQRNIVRWAFDSDRKVGDVSRFDIAGGYVIAQMTKRYEEGVQTPEQASARVLPILRKQKKAAMLKDQYGSSNFESLNGQGTANAGSALAMTTRSSVISGIGSEPYVVGKALALEAGQTSSLIEGEYGVYALKITEKNEAMELATYAPFTETIAAQRANQAAANAFYALKEKAEIKDNRAIFY